MVSSYQCAYSVGTMTIAQTQSNEITFLNYNRNLPIMMKDKSITVLIVLFLISITSCTNNTVLKDNGEWVKLTESQYLDGYFIYNNEIYGSYVSGLQDYKYCEPLKGVDRVSFQVCKGSGYAKDKNHVYYPISVVCEDAEEFSICYFDEYVVENADPANFMYLGNGYGVCGTILFLEGKEIPWNKELIKKYK